MRINITRIKSFITLLIIVSISSCNIDRKILYTHTEQIPFENNKPFSFEKVTDPIVWRQFQSLKEMQDACQMPEIWLKKISTENLVRTCINYPLYGIYLAYNNELDGINVIMSGFNGFQELIKREDAAKEILNYYENTIISCTKSHETVLSKVINPLRLGYIELIIASNGIPNLYHESHIKRLEDVARNALILKIQEPNVYSLNTIKYSLLIGARAKLKSDTLSFSDQALLKKFIDNGGITESLHTITKISNIL